MSPRTLYDALADLLGAIIEGLFGLRAIADREGGWASEGDGITCSRCRRVNATGTRVCMCGTVQR